MRLKRIALTCLVLLLAAALAAPWWIGRDTEARYRALVAAAADGPAPFSLNLEEFQRGWFRSRATVAVRPAGPQADAVTDALGAAEGRSLVLTDRIAHGLLPVPGAGDALPWRPALASVEGRLHEAGDPDSSPLARVAYRVGLDGGLKLTLTAPGARAPATGPEPAWRDLRIDAAMPAGPGTTVLDLAAARLEVPQPLGRVILNGLDGHLEVSPRDSGLPVGRMELKGREAVLAGADDASRLARATGLVLRAEFDGRGEQAHGSIRGRVEYLGSPREEYGPGEFRLTLNELDSDSFGRLLDSLGQLRGRGFRGRSGLMALAGVLLAEAPSLLAHGPVLELERLELATRDGPLTARGRLDLDSTEPVVLNNPYLLQRAVRGRFEVTVPPVAARHAALIHLRGNGLLEGTTPEAWLDGQVARGRLTRDDAGYHARIRLAKGRLAVNGRPWREVRQ